MQVSKPFANGFAALADDEAYLTLLHLHPLLLNLQQVPGCLRLPPARITFNPCWHLIMIFIMMMIMILIDIIYRISSSA